MSQTFMIGSHGVCVYKVTVDKQQYVIYTPNPNFTPRDSQSLDSVGITSPRPDTQEVEDGTSHQSAQSCLIGKRDVQLPLDKCTEVLHPPPVIVVDNVHAATMPFVETPCGLDSSRSSRVDTTDCEESVRGTSATDDGLAEYIVCVGPELYEAYFAVYATSTISPRSFESDTKWMSCLLFQLSTLRYLFVGIHDLFVLECPPSVQDKVESVFVDLLLRPWARGKSYLYFLSKNHPFAVSMDSTYAQILLSPQQTDYLLMLSTRPEHAISLVGRSVQPRNGDLDHAY